MRGIKYLNFIINSIERANYSSLTISGNFRKKYFRIWFRHNVTIVMHNRSYWCAALTSVNLVSLLRITHELFKKGNRWRRELNRETNSKSLKRIVCSRQIPQEIPVGNLCSISRSWIVFHLGTFKRRFYGTLIQISERSIQYQSCAFLLHSESCNWS